MLPDVAGFGHGDPRQFLDANADRYAADGLAPQELRRALQAIDSWGAWWRHWMDRSAELERASDATGATRPTREALLVQAMLCAHLAQYLDFEAPDRRELALQRKIELYRAVLDAGDPSGTRFEVPFGAATLPAFVRMPHGRAPDAQVGAVVYVGGLDAHKEDSHTFADLCLARGLAFVAFDGPGQGEALLRGLTLGPGAAAAVSAVIDAVGVMDGIDPSRVGVIGRSLGGYLAPRAAADDRRIRALVVWGAMVELALEGLPSHTRSGFRLITGSSGEAEAIERTRFIDLLPHAGRITQPTLIVHGGLDSLTPPEPAARLADAIGSNCRLDMIVGSGHCNHDVAHIVRPRMADFLALALDPGEARSQGGPTAAGVG